MREALSLEDAQQVRELSVHIADDGRWSIHFDERSLRHEEGLRALADRLDFRRVDLKMERWNCVVQKSTDRERTEVVSRMPCSPTCSSLSIMLSIPSLRLVVILLLVEGVGGQRAGESAVD